MENSQPPHVNDSHTSQQHALTFSMVDPSAYAQPQPQPPPQPTYVQPRHAAMEEPDEEQLSSEEEEEEEEEEAIDPTIVKDMEQLQRQIPGFRNHYRLIKRIGEGTFSTVYKAEDLLYDNYDNTWDLELEDHKWEAPPIKTRHNNRPYTKRQPKFVAIKKIYVTSSPQRILNELELLHDLQGCEAVCPLITAFRYTDQVLAVLPYFRHTDFRDYFRHMTMRDTSIYLRLLFIALENVHEHHILHRDIKPTNFLYNPKTQRGVLVDFGLAEREGVDGKPCVCHERPERRRERIESSLAANSGRTQLGYPEHDTRPSRRANRAGTRGFRAPEVLFKCTEQTTKLDIWSAGVILLTIMSKRFPFFNSSDDVDALIEISTIFGTREMKKAGLLHGCVLETTLPTIGTNGFTLEKIILWSTCRTEGGSDGKGDPLNEEELLAVDFLKRCMTLDPSKRLSAKEALQHDFLRLGLPQAETDEELNLVQPPAHSFDA